MKNIFWSNLPRLLTIGGFVGGFVVDHKNIDLLTKSVRKTSEMRLAYLDAIMRGGLL